MKGIALLLAALNGLAQQSPSREARFKTAAQSLSSGNYSAAEQGFESLLREAPNDPAVLGNLGVVYSRLGRQMDAIAVYKKVLQAHPDDFGINLNIGLIYFKQNEYALAKPFFDRALKKEPGNPQASRLLAACEMNTGETAAAMRRLEALRPSSPGDDGLLLLLAVGYHKQNQPEKAARVFGELLRSAKPSNADFLLGRAYYDATLFSDAEEAFHRVLQRESHFPGAHRELGKVLVSERKVDEALRELRAALVEDVADREAEYFLGALLAQEGQSAEAQPYLLQAIEHNPGSWGAYYYLGKIKLQEGDAAGAVSLLRQAVRLNPNHAATYYSLSRALQADGKVAEAKAALDHMRVLKAGALETEIEAVSGGRVIGAR